MTINESSSVTKHPSSRPMSVSTTQRGTCDDSFDEHLQPRRAPRASGETRTNTAESRPQRSARARSSPPPARRGHGPRESTTASAPAVPGLGMSTRRAGIGRNVPARSSASSSSSSRDTPYCSTSARVIWSMPGRAVVAAHLAPRPLQHVPAVDLVIQRMESSFGIGLGRPVQRVLQGTDRVESTLDTWGGTSPKFPLLC